MHTLRRGFLALAALLALARGGIVGAAPAAGPALQAARTPAGAVSPLVASGQARRLGPLPAGQVLRLAFVLRPRDPAGLQALAASRQALGPAGFAADFAPTAAARQAVAGFAVTAGLTVLGQFPGLVLVQGSAAKVAAALQVSLGEYRAGGQTFYGNAQAPTLPAAVAPLLAGVVGLTQVRYSAAPVHPAAAVAATSSYFTPDALRAAYGLIPAYGNGVTGAGTDIAVVMTGAFNPADVQTFSQTFGLPAAAGQFQAVPVAGDPAPSGPDVESTLDVEWAHAIAPGATITEYESGDLTEVDLMAAFAAALAAPTPPAAINMSFGAPELALPAADTAAWHALFAEAVARGSTPVAASGDFGAFVPIGGGAALQTVTAPADDPLVLAVGGTHPALAANNTRSAETAYLDLGGASFVPGQSQASGGGCSTVFSDLTPDEPATAASTCPGGARAVPDVSMAAQGMELYISGQGWLVGNGTSFAAPMWSGLLALAAQRAGHGLGWVRPAVNRLGPDPAAFQDITQGDNGLYSAGPGWDAVTGWGSPASGWTLVQDLAAAGPGSPGTGPQIAGLVVGGLPLYGPLVSNGSGGVDVLGSGFGAGGTVTLTGPGSGGASYPVPVATQGWSGSEIVLNMDSTTGGFFALFGPPAGSYTLTVHPQGGGSAQTALTLADFLYLSDLGPTAVAPAAGQTPALAQTVQVAVYTPQGLPDPVADLTAQLAVALPPIYASDQPPAITVWQDGVRLTPGPGGTYPVRVAGGVASLQVGSSGAVSPAAGAACVYTLQAPGYNAGCDDTAVFTAGSGGLSLQADVFTATAGGAVYAPVGTGTPLGLLLLDAEGNLLPAADTLGVSVVTSSAGAVAVAGQPAYGGVAAGTVVPVPMLGGAASPLVAADGAGSVLLAVYDTSRAGVTPLLLPVTFTPAAQVALRLQDPSTAAGGAAQTLQISAEDAAGAVVPFAGGAYLQLAGASGAEQVQQQVYGAWQTLSPGVLGYPLDLSGGSATVSVRSPLAETLTYQASLQFGGSTALSPQLQGAFVPGPAFGLQAFPVFPHMATSPAAAPEYTPVQVWTVDAAGNPAPSGDPLILSEGPGGPPLSVAAGPAGSLRPVAPSGGVFPIPAGGGTDRLYLAAAQPGIADLTLGDAADPLLQTATFEVDFVNSTPAALAVQAGSAPPGGTATLSVAVLDGLGQTVVNSADRIGLAVAGSAGALTVTDAAGDVLVPGADGLYALTAVDGLVGFRLSSAAPAYLTYTLTDLTDPAVAGASAAGLFANALQALPAAPPAAGVGSPYHYALQAGGGVPPYTWSLVQGSLPGGLTLSPAGVLAGTPAATGSFPLQVAVRDASGAAVTSALTLTVGAAPAAGGSGGGGSPPGGAAGTGPATPPNQPAIQSGTQVLETVDTAAGPQTLETSGGAVRLLLPAGSLSGVVTVEIAQVQGAPSAPPGTLLLGPVWRFADGGVGLLHPVTVTFALPPLPAGVGLAQIALYTLVNGHWSFVALVTPGSSPNEVSALLPHFSEWALMALTTAFTDVPTSFWAFPAVETLVARGVVAGYPDGRFLPARDVTRAEFVKMLALVVGLPPASAPAPFRDVPPGAWYAPYISAAAGAGLVRGSAGLARPDALITREQAAVLLQRALGRTTVLSGPTGRFTDAATIAPWAAAAVEEDAAAGLLQGYPDGSFRPAAPLTRAEAAAVLLRLATLLAG